MKSLFLDFHRICKYLLTLYIYSLFFDFNEQIRKTLGNMLIIKGYNKDIAKLTNVFLNMNIWVFVYTAPNEDSSIQKNTRNIKPKTKNTAYLITKFFLTLSEAI